MSKGFIYYTITYVFDVVYYNVTLTLWSENGTFAPTVGNSYSSRLKVKVNKNFQLEGCKCCIQTKGVTFLFNEITNTGNLYPDLGQYGSIFSMQEPIRLQRSTPSLNKTKAFVFHEL